MKVWPIDPLVPRSLRLEVPEKLPQGLTVVLLRAARFPAPVGKKPPAAGAPGRRG